MAAVLVFCGRYSNLNLTPAQCLPLQQSVSVTASINCHSSYFHGFVFFLFYKSYYPSLMCSKNATTKDTLTLRWENHLLTEISSSRFLYQLRWCFICKLTCLYFVLKCRQNMRQTTRQHVLHIGNTTKRKNELLWLTNTDMVCLCQDWCCSKDPFWTRCWM